MSDEEREMVLETTYEVQLDASALDGIEDGDVVVVRGIKAEQYEILGQIGLWFLDHGHSVLVLGLGADQDIELFDEEKMRFHGWERMRHG